MLKKGFLVLIIVVLLASLSSLAFAQDETVIATGLNGPRNLTYGSDGTLYIAEAGNAGDIEGLGPYGPVKYGQSGQISKVSPDGEWSVVIPELISTDVGFGSIYGTMAVHVTDDSYWVVLGGGPLELPEGQHAGAVVEYTGASMDMGQVIDLAAFENENNPDKNEGDKATNPADIAVAADGTIYIVDASGNDVLSWTEADGLQVFAAFPAEEGKGAAVPTAVAVGAEGDVYISYLTGFPFTPESSRVDVYGADGAMKKSYEGLSFVTDLLVTEDGSIYAVQFADSFGDTGWTPDSGSVVKVSDDGIEIVAEGLNLPYGIALSPDGDLVASVDSLGTEGRVIVIASM